ncbi:hypothetical protein [Bacillus sp. Hm123]|uniref:hypothetical protein n=1 Tax=Bacillus sp. Hm123 TaxID=3450745 RepID=UPI003F436F36
MAYHGLSQITSAIDEYNNSQNERSIQLSIGSAYHPHFFEQMTQLFAQADAQMYAGKSERKVFFVFVKPNAG